MTEKVNLAAKLASFSEHFSTQPVTVRIDLDPVGHIRSPRVGR
jgi:hypothetical protein